MATLNRFSMSFAPSFAFFVESRSPGGGSEYRRKHYGDPASPSTLKVTSSS